MTKHLLSHDYRWFVRKSFRSEIMALRRVDQKRRNRVLSRLILDPNSRGLRQAGLLRLAAVVSDMGAVAALSSCTWRAESGPGHPSDWRRIEPMEDHGQGRLRVYVHLVVSTVAGWPAVTDGLDGDLARLQQ